MRSGIGRGARRPRLSSAATSIRRLVGNLHLQAWPCHARHGAGAPHKAVGSRRRRKRCLGNGHCYRTRPLVIGLQRRAGSLRNRWRARHTRPVRIKRLRPAAAGVLGIAVEYSQVLGEDGAVFVNRSEDATLLALRQLLDRGAGDREGRLPGGVGSV